ncbi:ABC transporter ATP-binding protein [Pusillimonas noertemannii]|uniref:Peptide/nickel transport system ATP-binding protein n=1 Tax=Pusillimonas noertemannii TaxID=305977 RepID=A0A2U1CL03_9BURK|nr:ABC transporter ATP-binding protein [Pusillimonas noertemannii]NYT69196.1 ABC transporter ATP-binding protein [Pusillimonas noertemannii]PVY61664.1 peptide/nickel transport system ATP-binding protein [Pusillimonas noertemannii]TFL09605.1 ABC transporter ATP-binding protein [Pusillimonas noertemannii]
MNTSPLLEVRNLSLSVRGPRGTRTPILRGLSLCLESQAVHGLVGESGGGKTMVGKAILGVLPDGARIDSGSIWFDGQDLTLLRPTERRRLLGRSMSMILQNPMTALNPVMRIETQITDVLQFHMGMKKKAARARALEMLEAVRIRDPERVMKQHPHQLSGGMCQRIVIAIAFACRPKLIIADEPTTALDVTVQHQILRLIRELQEQFGTSVLFVTHDLGVVAKVCDAISVIFAGTILESGTTHDVFRLPKHRYTQALLDAVPRYDRPNRLLQPISSTLHAELFDEIVNHQGVSAA